MDLVRTEKERQKHYAEFILEEVAKSEEENIELLTKKNGIIGSQEFVDKISGLVGRNVSLRKKGDPKNHFDPFSCYSDSFSCYFSC